MNNKVQVLLAWAIHLFTASGLVLCFLACLEIFKSDFRMACIYMLGALFVDGVDGTMARAAKVTDVLPKMNGKIMDYLIDFIGYAFLPALFYFNAELSDGWQNWLATFFILLSSILYYAKEGMVQDNLFIGFPVMWNVVVFFQYFVFDLPSIINLIIIALLSVLHFVPWKYAYPSKMKTWQLPTLLVTVVGIVSALLLLYYYPESNPAINWILIIVLAYFVLLTLILTFLKR